MHSITHLFHHISFIQSLCYKIKNNSNNNKTIIVEIEGETETETDKQIDRQTDRQTDRDKDRDKQSVQPVRFFYSLTKSHNFDWICFCGYLWSVYVASFFSECGYIDCRNVLCNR